MLQKVSVLLSVDEMGRRLLGVAFVELHHLDVSLAVQWQPFKSHSFLVYKET